MPAPRPREIVHAPLTDDWRQWIAENRLRDCTPEPSFSFTNLDVPNEFTYRNPEIRNW
jgi:hypothetical protein